ncbi:MAG: histidine kinase dimerization/phospho-acceptor domain-containing protein, partial [Chthoniobacterales bacterium]
MLSLVIEWWLFSLYSASTAVVPAVAELSIRQASAAGALYLAALNLLRLSVREKGNAWRAILRNSRVWLVLTIGIVALCQTKLFLQEAHLLTSPGSATAIPVYGYGIYVYAIWFCLAFIALVVGTWRDLRKTSGRQKAELSFILIAGIAALAFSLLLAFALDFLIGASKSILFAPFRVVVFSVLVAYGIATRKIMEVGFFFRRAMAYTVLLVYLLALYGVMWLLVRAVLVPIFPQRGESFAHVAAAIVVAFAMAPARGVSQSLANRLFLGTRGLDFRATMSQATAILKSVTTLHDLLSRFAETISHAVATERVLILLNDKHEFAQHFPPRKKGASQSCLDLPRENPIIRYLIAHPEPLVLDELHRIRPTQELNRVMSQMSSLNIAIAMGIFSREHLAGVMLLGPRLSGRIYGSMEQNSLQVLCGQLAVAIDNAQLFTEVQNARIYNDTLLENLTTGVIAADADGRVTVFNNEAGQILALSPKEVLDGAITELPRAVSAVMVETLRTGQRQENRELTLQSDEGADFVRVSSSIFHAQEGQMLGALMVLTDITALKRLESQIRRSDRLASLGTLSAGMAHEIKNPLVSIKTFAQLLPERYQDSDFRDTFSNLIGHEIDRIDSLVNQLLRFARPAKPFLRPMHVHETLEKSLALVGHRLYQKEIQLIRFWNAEVDTIRADADQLEQV